MTKLRLRKNGERERLPHLRNFNREVSALHFFEVDRSDGAWPVTESHMTKKWGPVPTQAAVFGLPGARVRSTDPRTPNR